MTTRVEGLVERFEANLSSYKEVHYKETQLRREFLDPLFRELGWDVENAQGYAEAFKDVVHEDAIRIGLTTKAPDYCFRLGGQRKFFVEAKRPSVNLHRDSEGAYQLRRYAWSASLPVSVLTDFEDFIVYDCRSRPELLDGPAKGRLLTFNFRDYVRRWDELSVIFSKDAAVSGAFDQYVGQVHTARGTAAFDDAFLADIERWRETLARNIVALNPSVHQSELNFAVQTTIDRVIFLRICEDRGIETYGQLGALLQTSNTYAHLIGLFRQADDKYNSGLFHFTFERDRDEGVDEVTPDLVVDDDTVKSMIGALYYPDSPYEFSVIPADILGHVYEKFLGKTISVGEDRRVEVDEKPEVKKAGGVYYTPNHIVEYTVGHTLGPLLAGANLRQAAEVKLVDPACGSGSFLIVAYQYLVDWHRDFYVQDGPEKHRNVLYEGPGGGWALTVSEKKRILTNSIHGVDIDAQAVEVTKLSLLLKVLEGESHEVLAKQLALFHERALPDLGRNIKCGNSLVGTDWYTSHDGAAADQAIRARINAFDWVSEFPHVFEDRRRGFDAVVGNPPYVFGEYLDLVSKAYYRDTFAVAAAGQVDLYCLFVERALALTRAGGRFAMIVPDAILARDEGSVVRRLLLERGLDRIYHCGLVFTASVAAAVVLANKGSSSDTIAVDRRTGLLPVAERECARARFTADPGATFLIHMSDDEAAILERIRWATDRLSSHVTVSRGEELGKKHVVATGPIPILVGEDIARYRLSPPSHFVEALAKDPDMYVSPKIVVVKTGSGCIAALDSVGVATMQSVYNLHVTSPDVDPRAILAILNSRFVAWYVAKTFTAYKLLFPQLNQTTLLGIPIPRNLAANQRGVVAAVDNLQQLLVEHDEARTPGEVARVEREIDVVDRHIDRLVYGLFDITDVVSRGGPATATAKR